MGKMPRKQTDPLTAFKKALIPGMGMSYNGYKMIAPIVGIAPVFYASMGVVLLGWNGIPSAWADELWPGLEDAVSSGFANYDQYRQYYGGKPTLMDDLVGAGELFAEALFIYGTSLIALPVRHMIISPTPVM